MNDCNLLPQVWQCDWRMELEGLLADGGSESEVISALQEKVMSEKVSDLFGCVLTPCDQVSVPSGHPRVVNALLFGILCDRPRAPTFFRHLYIVSLHPRRNLHMGRSASACEAAIWS